MISRVVAGLALALFAAGCTPNGSTNAGLTARSSSAPNPSIAFGGDGCGTPGIDYVARLVRQEGAIAVISATVSKAPVDQGQASGPVPDSRVPLDDVTVLAQGHDLGNGPVTTVQIGAVTSVNPLPPADYLMLLFPATAPAAEHVIPGQYGIGIEDTFVVSGDSVRQRCPSLSHSESKPALLPGGSGHFADLQRMLITAIRTHGAQPHASSSSSIM